MLMNPLGLNSGAMFCEFKKGKKLSAKNSNRRIGRCPGDKNETNNPTTMSTSDSLSAGWMLRVEKNKSE